MLGDPRLFLRPYPFPFDQIFKAAAQSPGIEHGLDPVDLLGGIDWRRISHHTRQCGRNRKRISEGFEE